MKMQILVSDISGERIDGDFAHVTIVADEKRFELDAKASEVAELLSVATEKKPRGRKPKEK